LAIPTKPQLQAASGISRGKERISRVISMRIRPAGMLAFLIYLAFSCGHWPIPADAAWVDRESLGDELKTLWESIESLEFRYEDFATNDRGGPEPPPGYATREDCRYAPPERLAKQSWFREADGAWKMGNEFRLDGRRKVSLGFLKDRPEVLESVRVSNLGTFTEAVSSLGGTGGFLWLPDGEPIHKWLDDRAKVSATGDGNQVEVTFPITQGRTLVYTLDRARDWLPSRVRLGLIAEGFVEYRVTEYQRDNGRWFFRAGQIISSDQDGGRGRRAFEFSEVRINRGHAPESFTVPSRLEDGVVIFDQTKRRVGQVVGGFPAIERFNKKYGLVSKPSIGTPVEAAQHEESFPWPTVIGVASVSALVAACLLSVRARFRSFLNPGDRP
jgi:hypothetical protein